MTLLLDQQQRMFGVCLGRGADASAPPDIQDQVMNVEQLRLQVDVTGDGDLITGT